MGIRSDVGFCCTTEIANKVKEKFPWVKEESMENVSPEGSLFHFTDVKWYFESDKEISELYKFLETVPDEDYLISVACHDYPESSDGDRGSWVDNPWNMHRELSVRVYFEEV